MGRERYLVALVVPPPVATEVDGLRRALGDRARRRIPPHVTLVPPVNVNDERLPEALSVLREAAAPTAPLRLRLGPVTTFAPANPVVYLAVSGDSAGLGELRDRVFRPPLRRKVTHEFTPHVTVGRPPKDRIGGAVAALAHYDAEVTVDRLRLFREEPGQLWVPVTDMAFGAPAVVGRGGLPLEVTTSALPPPDATPLLGRYPASRPGTPGGPGGGAAGGPERPQPVPDGAPGPAAAPAPGPGTASGQEAASGLGTAQGQEAASGLGTERASGPEAAFGPGEVVGTAGEVSLGSFAMTARREGTVVGLAVGRTVGPIAHLEWLVVVEGTRRQGIGRHLLAAVEARARDRSCAVVLAVAPATPAAGALLAGSGWRGRGPVVGPGGWQHWQRRL